MHAVYTVAVTTIWCWLCAVGHRSQSPQELLERNANRSAIFGRALSFDWDFREGEEPPMKETIDIRYAKEVTETISIVFKAFNKKWNISARKNDMLLSDKLSFEFRTIDGQVLHRSRGPRDCFYIGTADASQHEAGLAAVTTCNGVMRALIITNLNDYVIIPTSGSLTRRRLQRDLKEKYMIQVANLTEFETYLKERGFRSSNTSVPRRFRRDEFAGVVLAPLPPPTGRAVYVEVGAIFDQYYIQDFKNMMSTKKDDIYIHAAEVFNFAQLWFIHPTFGFQVWLTLRTVVFVEDDIVGGLDHKNVKSYPAQICKWQKKNFTDSSLWDEVFVFSSREGIWHGRVGMAQRSGVCEKDGMDKCAGVTHMNFQMATLARLVAHEGSHPLGMTDDYDGDTSKLCFTGLMRRGVWQDHDWSTCSVQHFQRWLEVSSTKCVQRHNTPSIPDSVRQPFLPVNIAWRASVVQSSTFENELRWGAWKATDGAIAGVANANPILGSCTQTLHETDPWIRVQLADEFAYNFIDFIHIYNRADCCSERLRDFEVRVGYNTNITANPLCNYHEGKVPGGSSGMAVIRCKVQLRGKYVSIQIRGKKEVLTVCEIQVFQSVYLADFRDISDHTCVDHHGFCSFWGDLGECEKESQKPYLHRMCPFSCKLCSRPGAVTHEPFTLATPTGTSAYPGEDCEDTHPSCLHVVANQECRARRLYRTMCRKSCGFCGKEIKLYAGVPEERRKAFGKIKEKNLKKASESSTSRDNEIEELPCRDRSAGCYIRVRHGLCKWHAETRELCAESCGICGIRRVSPLRRNRHRNCFDIHGSCAEWSRVGYCVSNESVKDFCPLTCDLCEQQRARNGQRAPRTREDSPTYRCRDRHYKCRSWARKGFCIHNRYTQNRCHKSCRICQS